MSIIYEALKRIEEKARKNKPEPGTGAPPEAKKYKIRQIAYVISILLLLGLLALFIDRPSGQKAPLDKALIPQPNTKQTPTPVKKATTQVRSLPAPQKEASPPKSKKLPKL